jgi:sigma-E factor negative regulatory protein RseA
MTNKKLESISAILDDELQQVELDLALAELEEEQVNAFGRYSLIGDVLRNEQELLVDNQLSERIMVAVAELEQHETQPITSSVTPGSVIAISEHPKWRQAWHRIKHSSTGKGLGQLAIAASVAIVAVVGVSNMPGQGDNSPTPVLNTVPLSGGITPVSADGLREKPSANQVTQARINALMADHNQQLRAKEEPETEDDADTKDNNQ